MKTKFILLWLEAPLQSWGVDSLFDRRETLYFPTKSGIIGLLLCAWGKSGPQRELLARLSPCAHTVISYGVSDAGMVQRKILQDFHMVGSGYDAGDPWDTLNIPKKADGGKPVGGGSKLTYRYYLQDAKFAVLIECEQDIAEQISEALIKPEYDIYLGRKNCVPTYPVYQGLYEHKKQALEKTEEIIQDKNNLAKSTDKNILARQFRVEEKPQENYYEELYLMDVPIEFGVYKKYTGRKVYVILEQ